MFDGFNTNLSGSIIAFLGIHDVNFSAKLNEANLKASKFANTVNTIMNRALLAGASAFTASVIAASKYEQQMALVNTLLGESSKGFEQLKKDVLSLAAETPDSVENLSKGLYDLISSGADASNAIESLALASKAAVAGMTSTEVAIQAGMATVNAYGLSMKELNRIYDLQFQAVNYGVMTYEQLAGAVGNVLPMAAALGVQLEEVYGSLAFITKAGIDATSAATYLSKAFQSMVENQDKWKALGISIFDATGAFAGLNPIIEKLVGKLNGLNKEQQMAILQSLGMEERAAKAIRTMVSNYEGFIETMNNTAISAGAMEAAFSKTYRTFENQLKIFRNIVQASFIETGNALLPIIASILNIFNQYPETVKLIVKEFSAMAITAMTLTAAFKAYNLVASVIPQLNKLTAASFGPIGLAITAVAGAVTLFINLMEKQKEKQQKFYENIAKGAIDVAKLESEYRKLSSTAINIEAAHKKTEEAQKRLNEAIARGEKDVENLQAAYQKAKEEEDQALMIKSKLQDAELKLTKAYKDQGISVADLKEKFGQLGEEQKKQKYDRLIAELKQLQNEFDIVSQKTTTFVQGYVDLKTGEYIQGYERQIMSEERMKILEALSQKMQKVRDALEMLKTPSEDIKEKFENIASMSERTKEHIEAKIKALEALRPEISGNAELSEKLAEKMNELKEKYQSVASKAETMTEKQKLLKDVEIETTNEVKNQIKELEKLYPIIQSDEYALNQYNQRLKELKNKIDPTVIAQEKLKNIGIETSYAIRAQIEELEQHRPQIEGDTYAIQQYNEKMKELKEKIDPAIIAQQQLKSAGIETSEMIQQQIDDLQQQVKLVEGNEYATAQLNKKIVELKTKLEEATPAYLAFHEAGLTNSKSIQGQIALMEQAIPAAQGDALAMGELLIKTKELYDQLGDARGFESFIEKTGLSKKAAIDLMNGIHNTTQKVGYYVGELANAISQYNLFGEKTDVIIGAMNNFSQKLKEAHTPTELLGYGMASLGEIISGVSKDTNAAAKVFETLTNVLSATITSGFDPFSIAISAVTGIFSLFSNAGQEVNRTIEEVREMVKQAGIDIEEIEKIINRIEFKSPLIDDLKSNIDSILESMRTAVGGTFELLQLQLKSLTDQIKVLTTPFNVRIEVQDAIENTQKLIESINSTVDYLDIDDMDAFNQLLNAQLAHLTELISQVKVGTPAYNDLRAAIDNIIQTMANLNGVQQNTQEYLQRQEELLLRNITLNELYIVQLQEQLENQNLERSELERLQSELSRALSLREQYGQELKKINELLNNLSTSFQENSKTIDDNSKNIRQLVEAFHSARQSISDFRTEIKNINSDGIVAMAGHIRNVAISVFDLDDKFQKSYKTLKDTISEVAKLSSYYASFDSRNLINQLQEQIILNLQLLIGLPKGSKAYLDMSQAIMQAYSQMLSLGASAEAVLLTANALGISLADLTAKYQDNSEVVDANIKALRGNADVALLLTKANASIKNQINALTRELERQQAVLAALKEQKAELKIEYLARKEDLDKQLAEWKKTLNELIAEKTEMNVQFDLEIGDATNKLGQLQNIFEVLDRNEVAIDFYEIAAAIREISGASLSLKINWENALSVMFTDYDTFTANLNSASEALDKLNYFAVNFSDTQADEQILLMIFQMRNFLNTLNPESQAYKDAKKGMDELILKFMKLSGEAIPEAYQSMLDEMADLNDRLVQLQDRKIAIDVDIQNLDSRKEEILKRLDEIANRKVEIDIELEKNKKNLLEQIDVLKGKITDLEAKKLHIDIQLGENINKANQDIETLNKNLEDYYNKKQNIISQINDINSQIDQLNQYLSVLSSSDPAALANVSLNELYRILVGINGEVGTFGLTWESTWQNVIDDFSKFFEYDAKSEVWGISQDIQKIFEQIEFFKIDFDTTEMDEQLNALIFRMKSYIQELNPESEAYAQAQAALDQFIEKFTDMGGILDEEAAKSIYSEKTQSAIDTLQARIKALTEEKSKIDFDISEALNKIQEISQKIEDMKAQAEAEKATIDIEIVQAQGQIDNLLALIEELKKKAEAEKIQLEIDFDKLDAELLQIYDKMAALEDEKFSIDLDIQDVQNKISALQNQIDQFDLTQFINQQEALNQEIEVTNSEISNFQNLLEQIIRKKDEYNFSIDVKIQEATSNINNLQQQLVELQNDFNTVDLQLDVDIATAINKINQLQNSINSLSGTSINITGSGTNIYIQVNPAVMHSGGIIKAHSGLLNWDERLIIGQVGEAVIPRNVVQKYPIASWQKFIRTGNVDSLRGSAYSRNRLEYHFTFHNVPIGMDIVDGPIYDRISYRRRKLEASGNPYA